MTMTSPDGQPLVHAEQGSASGARMPRASKTASLGINSLSRRGAGGRSTAVPPPSRRWKTRVLTPVAIFSAAAALMAYAARDSFVPAVDVHVAPVVARPLSDQDASGGTAASDGDAPPTSSSGVIVQAPGWVEPDPFPISIPVLVDGVIKEVLALEGDRLEAGQVVARLMDEEYQLAKQAARATVKEREADLARLRANVDALNNAVQVVQADVDALRDEVARKQDLVPAGGLSAGDFKRLQIRLRGTEARLALARSEVAAAEAAVHQGEAALESAEIAFAEAALRLERTEIRAPASGVVLSRTAKPGMRLAMAGAGPGEAHESGIMTLYDPERLQVRVDVPLADAGKVAVGTRAEVSSESVPNATFHGTVVRAVHEANIQRNTVQFKVAIENPSPVLKPEMLTRVRLRPQAPSSLGTAAPRGRAEASGGGIELVLPADVLVNRRDNRAVVWLVGTVDRRGRSSVELRDVTIANGAGEYVAITDGVRPGDRAVVNPPSSLRPGARVRIVGEAAVASTLN